jgi:hypothetical protein
LTENDHRLIEHADAVVIVEPGRAFRHDPVAQREPRDHLDPLPEQAPRAHGNLACDAAPGDDEHGGEAAVRLEQGSHGHDRDRVGVRIGDHDLGDQALHEARIARVHGDFHFVSAGLGIRGRRDLGDLGRKAPSRIGVQRDFRGVARPHAHDVAVRQRGPHDPAAAGVANDQHGLARRDLLVRFGELAQHDAVGGRLDARVADVEEGGPQRCLRDGVRRRESLDLLARRDFVGEQRLAAVEVARGLLGDGAGLRHRGGDLVVGERGEDLPPHHGGALFDGDVPDHAAAAEGEAHLVGRRKHADRTQRLGGRRLLHARDAHRRRALGRLRCRAVAAARERERGGECKSDVPVLHGCSMPPIAYSTSASAPNAWKRVTFPFRRACVRARWASRYSADDTCPRSRFFAMIA